MSPTSFLWNTSLAEHPPFSLATLPQIAVLQGIHFCSKEVSPRCLEEGLGCWADGGQGLLHRGLTSFLEPLLLLSSRSVGLYFLYFPLL